MSHITQVILVSWGNMGQLSTLPNAPTNSKMRSANVVQHELPTKATSKNHLHSTDPRTHLMHDA